MLKLVYKNVLLRVKGRHVSNVPSVYKVVYASHTHMCYKTKKSGFNISHVCSECRLVFILKYTYVCEILLLITDKKFENFFILSIFYFKKGGGTNLYKLLKLR